MKMIQLSASKLTSENNGLDYPCPESGFQSKIAEPEIKVYKRRFWMLALYVMLAILGAMMFPLYVSMANVTGCYYEVTQHAVNWTTQIFLIIYVILVVPASFLIKILDLRWSLICGSILNTAASGLQFFTLKTDGFVFVMISCAVSACASMFIMGLAPYLVARWFPSNELSRACAVGVFGNQIGVSIGLLFIPLMVSSNCTEKGEIEDGKKNVAIILTTLNAVVLILFLFSFQKSPKIPPNVGELIKKEENKDESTMKMIVDMMKNIHFVLIFLVSGLMAGNFYAFTTVANDLMIRYFPQQEVKIALMTTLFSIFGIVGSIIGGYILDFTHRFKETALVTCIMSLVFYIITSSVLQLKLLWLQFITTSLFGYFVGSFLPIGLEYGIEIIFPSSEMISSNLQFWSMQFTGVILIQIVSRVLDNFGPTYSHIAMGVSLLICCIISSFLTKDYKRSKQKTLTHSNNVQ